MNRLYYTILLIFIVFFSLNAQENHHKLLKAIRVQKAPVIDGKPDDLVWQQAPVATDFVMFNPGDGDPIPKEYDTNVKVVYDNVGIYVLAEMKVPDVKSIRKEFGLRDQMVQADNFSLIVNPLSTPNNSNIFMVFASGAQADGIQKYNPDWSWNAVWKSNVYFTGDAWYVEMAIPYSALRFQNEKVQEWSIGFTRHIDSKRQDFSWTYIDKSKSGDIIQFLGKLTDLSDIKPPVRLSLYPYASVVHTRFNGENTTDYGFGMDLKYGLSESYTLDATLIPDFSDTPYDDLELNLGPFEKFYKEQRQFFTEGVNLFNKGHLFYSRRIGGKPIDYYGVRHQTQADEVVLDNPEKVKLINAVKISGRSSNGLGIGFFNAITNKAEATIQNTVTGDTRKFVTNPYTNYNIMVLDYNYSGNSSVGFINTNVIRQGDARDANVSALTYDLYGQKNTLKTFGALASSFIFEDHQTVQGWRFYNKISKRIKQHKFGFLIRMQDDKFDSNDLGFNRRNNYANFDVSYAYRILKPTKHFNALSFSVDLGFDHRYKPFVNIQNDIEISVFATNKKYLSYGFGIEAVTDRYDYYEPRVSGRFYLDKTHGGGWAFISTDYRKKMAVDVKVTRYTKFNDEQNYTGLRIAPRFRVNNQLKINYSFDLAQMNNDKGFADIQGNDIIFGNRQQKSITNTLGANYYFNTKSGLNLNFRYYWAPVHYDRFYILQEDGTLLLTDTYSNNKDINFNIWNIDLGYAWEFAPGSKLSLLYRNTISNVDQLSSLSFNDNVDNLFQQPQKHSFVMKMTYYIDYNTVRNKWF